MKHLRNDVHNLFDNTHARNKIYHGIVCIANETRYIRVETFIDYTSLETNADWSSVKQTFTSKFMLLIQMYIQIISNAVCLQ